MTASTSRNRWRGHETCGFCMQTYVYELERHCFRCDRPICPLCIEVRTVREALVCPECRPAEPRRKRR